MLNRWWLCAPSSLSLFPVTALGQTVLVALQNHLLLFQHGDLKQQISANCPVSRYPKISLLQLAQLPKCLLKEAVAYKRAHPCGWAYLGPRRYLTSRCIITGTAEGMEKPASSTLCTAPPNPSLGDVPANQMNPSMRSKYCKGGRLHSSLFFMRVCAHKLSNKYWLGFCYMPATMWGIQWWARHMPFSPPYRETQRAEKLYITS